MEDAAHPTKIYPGNRNMRHIDYPLVTPFYESNNGPYKKILDLFIIYPGAYVFDDCNNVHAVSSVLERTSPYIRFYYNFSNPIEILNLFKKRKTQKQIDKIAAKYKIIQIQEQQ